jgi:hypothetical protein
LRKEFELSAVAAKDEGGGDPLPPPQPASAYLGGAALCHFYNSLRIFYHSGADPIVRATQFL